MLPTILIVDNEDQAKEYINKHLGESQLFEIYPEGEKFKINEVRFLKRNLATAFKKKLVIVLWWFDTATLEAQNASLKLLEEYAQKFDFYLVVKNLNLLLPTILSRAGVKDLRKREEVEVKKDYKDLFYPSLKLFEVKNKEEAVNFFEDFIRYLSLMAKEEMDARFAAVGKEALKTFSLLQSNNLNPQLAVDYILIFAWKKFKMKE